MKFLDGILAAERSGIAAGAPRRLLYILRPRLRFTRPAGPFGATRSGDQAPGHQAGS
jgi:hypothetical protein